MVSGAAFYLGSSMTNGEIGQLIFLGEAPFNVGTGVREAQDWSLLKKQANKTTANNKSYRIVVKKNVELFKIKETKDYVNFATIITKKAGDFRLDSGWFAGCSTVWCSMDTPQNL